MASNPSAVCPNCGKETVAQYRPFCSKRCADVDLARWFGEDYVIRQDDPTVDPEDFMEEVQEALKSGNIRHNPEE